MFGLYEVINNQPINWNIIVESDTAEILTLNSSDILSILTKKQIGKNSKICLNSMSLEKILKLRLWITFPFDHEIFEDVIKKLKNAKRERQIVETLQKTA